MTDQEYDALDLAVARAEIAAGQLDVRISDGGVPTIMKTKSDGWEQFRPSVSWEHAGPIIEREHIGLLWDGGTWQADASVGGVWGGLARSGQTPLVAAMRVYLAMRSRPRLVAE